MLQIIGKGAKVSPAAVTTSAPSNTGAQTGVAFAAANWSEANASAPFAASSGRKAKALGVVDPRWDVVGFDTWLAGSPCVRVGFLRATKPVGRHQVPEDTWVRKLPPGAGIDGVQLYAILSAAFGTQRSPDLAASELAALLQVLEGDQVHEDDLVWWDWLALSADDGDAGRAEAFRAFTTYKAQCVVLPTIDGHGSTSVFACMEPMALLALSCFCQRIYNASDEEVKAGLDLSKFFDLSGLLMSLQRESDSQLAFVAEMLEKVLTLSRTLTLTIALTLTLTLTLTPTQVVRALTPVATDTGGFEVLVEEAQLAFIRAPVIKRWAAEGGPIRRRQEIPEEDRITGRLPTGKIVSLSHCWDATCNCDPTGKKMAELAQALVDIDATGEEDGVSCAYAPRSPP